MAKKELIPAKQEKARERIKTFRAELLDYRQSFDRLKKDRDDAVSNFVTWVSSVLNALCLSKPRKTAQNF
jgi:hypothetical protein